MPTAAPSLSAALWPRVASGVVTDCWPWVGHTQLGYGVFNHHCVKQWAHRAAWETVNGPIPPGLRILHRCDNRCCCNPFHLWLSTQRENIADMVRKGRSANQKGERNPRAILTEADVYAVRHLLKHGWRHRDIAELFDVSSNLICEINRGRAWAGVGFEDWADLVHEDAP